MTTDIPPAARVVMTPEVAALLREPFPAEKIGKLPRLTCGDCSRAKGACNEHPKTWCETCNAKISPRHIHLDYVGHADITDRFLQVDPYWDWEPLAFDPRGLPAFDEHGGLWIRLTLAGVIRLGYGDAQGKTGPNAVKEAIGDALRNAGMRFGVALDLWRKDFPEAEEGPRGGRRPGQSTRPAQTTGPGGSWPEPATDPKWLAKTLADISAARALEDMTAIGNQIDAAIAAGRLAKHDEDTIRELFMPKREKLLAERNAAHQADQEQAEEVGA